jgi:cytochrome c-type biogenesis protein CcmH/NrfF
LRRLQTVRRVGLGLLVAVVAAAQSPNVEAEARRVFGLIMSPYCPGQLLSDCTSAQADALRDSVRARLTRGMEPAEVVAQVAAVYGGQVLALPPNQGFGRLAWLGPVSALLAGLLLLLWWVRQRLPAPAPGGSPIASGGAPDLEEATQAPADPGVQERRARLLRELEAGD